MPVSMNNNVSQTVSAQKVSKPNQEPKKTEKTTMSTGTIVAIGTGLAALAAVGIYLVSKGKAKTPVSTLEKVFKDGTKVTKEITDGKTVMKVFDKEGRLVKTRTKEIIRSTNPANGKKYVTIKKNTNDVSGNRIKNKYYSKDGKKLFQTEQIFDKNGFPLAKTRWLNGDNTLTLYMRRRTRVCRSHGVITEHFSEHGTKRR